MNGVEKYVREATPIQEEERASGKPAAKARPILKPSPTSGWDSTPLRQGQWIDIEVKRSKDHSCFQMSKFVTHSLRIEWLINARKFYQTIQDVGPTK